MSRKEDLYKEVHHQIGVNLRPYEEDKTRRNRTYTSVHLENMESTNRIRAVNYLKNKGYRVESNGGYGTAIWFK